MEIILLPVLCLTDVLPSHVEMVVDPSCCAITVLPVLEVVPDQLVIKSVVRIKFEGQKAVPDQHGTLA